MGFCVPHLVLAFRDSLIICVLRTLTFNAIQPFVLMRRGGFELNLRSIS